MYLRKLRQNLIGSRASQLLFVYSSCIPLNLTAAALPAKDLTLTIRYEGDALFYCYCGTGLATTLIKYDPRTEQHYRVAGDDPHCFSTKLRLTGFSHVGAHASCVDEPCCSLRQRIANTETELVYTPDDGHR